jgi:hypothetical protein
MLRTLPTGVSQSPGLVSQSPGLAGPAGTGHGLIACRLAAKPDRPLGSLRHFHKT